MDGVQVGMKLCDMRQSNLDELFSAGDDIALEISPIPYLQLAGFSAHYIAMLQAMHTEVPCVVRVRRKASNLILVSYNGSKQGDCNGSVLWNVIAAAIHRDMLDEARAANIVLSTFNLPHPDATTPLFERTSGQSRARRRPGPVWR